MKVSSIIVALCLTTTLAACGQDDVTKDSSKVETEKAVQVVEESADKAVEKAAQVVEESADKAAELADKAVEVVDQAVDAAAAVVPASPAPVGLADAMPPPKAVVEDAKKAE